VNGVSYSYDKSGNLITEGNTDYSYTYNNYLNTSHHLATTTYLYDHQGQRVQKTGGTTTIYPSTLYEVTATNTEKHIYGNGILLATIKSDTPAPTLYHNHLDHLDSTKAVTTPDGYLNQELEYYPFGQTKVDNQYGNLTQSNQYIGQNFDQETELSYLNARYYDGVRGQMLSQDPVFLGVGVDERSTLILKDPQLQNSYGYGRNNPLIYKDPNGELAFLAPAIIGGVLGAIGGVATEAISGRDSSFSDYASAAGQGFVVGLGTGGVGTVATAYKLSGLVKTGAISGTAGTLTATTELGTDYIKGESTDYHDLAAKSILAAGTAGTLSRLPKVKGRTPNLGTEAFFIGKHTQRQGAEEAVQVSVQSLGSAGRAYNSGGSSRSSSNKVSSNQYKSITLQLMKTKTALSKGDYDGATRALNSASNSLNNKRRK
jgi:RHS repeat-associated protein